MYCLESAFFVRFEAPPRSMYGRQWMPNFRPDMAYRILGFFAPEVGAQPQALLSDSQGQSCFVPLPHLRAVACIQGITVNSLPLSGVVRDERVSLEDWVRRVRSADLNQPQALA